MKKECPTTKSIANREYLLDKLKAEEVDKHYKCTCGKLYIHATSLYHHRSKCKKYDRSSTKNLRKELNYLRKEVHALRQVKDI